ncbi:hypothetical protein AVEN_215816-1 [Araneus ventricosus]|uniref:Uncharacterized protein n=1 Tax=Araneus ventricosus TaxID=182803 RepID=A0A4Y2PAK6_ARAVE|nr:hypothetical protein AVEN_215816-1 [Araneus ventricosus]
MAQNPLTPRECLARRKPDKRLQNGTLQTRLEAPRHLEPSALGQASTRRISSHFLRWFKSLKQKRWYYKNHYSGGNNFPIEKYHIGSKIQNVRTDVPSKLSNQEQPHPANQASTSCNRLLELGPHRSCRQRNGRQSSEGCHGDHRTHY